MTTSGPIQFAWHVHHDQLIEPLRESLEVRIDYIWKHKPLCEIPTRLRLLRIVHGELPPTVVEVGWAWIEAWQALVKTERIWAEQDRSWAERGRGWVEGGRTWLKAEQTWAKTKRSWNLAAQAWVVTIRANVPAIEALHTVECPDCPWDGHTIFP